MHYLSIDDSSLQATLRQCGVGVVGLSYHGFYGDELQGARRGVVCI